MNEFAVAFVREFIPASRRYQGSVETSLRYITDGINWVMKKFYDGLELDQEEVAQILRYCGIEEVVDEDTGRQRESHGSLLPALNYKIDTVQMRHLRMVTREFADNLGEKKEQQLRALQVRLHEWKGPQAAVAA